EGENHNRGGVGGGAAPGPPPPPRPPAATPEASPSRRPERWVRRPTPNAVSADPSVNRAAGSPAAASPPSICCASRAPTVTPAASPAPPKICEHTTTVSDRRYSS